MSPADRLLVGVWNRLTSDWTRIATFSQMGALGEGAAREAIHKSNTYFVQQQLLHGEYQKLLKDRQAFIRGGYAEQLPINMTEASVKTFRQTLYAATLIFAHSILDAAVYDCVRICAISAPGEWSSLLGGRKITLADAQSNTYKVLLDQAIEAEVSKLERESLLVKVDRVFQICRPTKSEYLTNGFRFDRDRLKRIDDTRHKVVHASNNSVLLDKPFEDLEFMQKSGLHIFSIVGERFDLCFSGTEAFEALVARHRES